jgi:hypothetical protein
LYSSPRIVRMIRLRRMKLVGYTAWMGWVMELREIGWCHIVWSYVAQGSYEWKALAKKVMILRVA